MFDTSDRETAVQGTQRGLPALLTVWLRCRHGPYRRWLLTAMIRATSDSFVHLHTHTEFSMLDGAARLDDLFAECVRMGMASLAMTDHGNVFGAYEFWKKANAHGIKPIIGMEGYLSPGSRHERKRVVLDGVCNDVDNPGEMYTHMTLLAENTEGMHNLFRLSSVASLEGYYYKPRMDRELLATYGKGIIATTGCPSGEVQRLLQQDKFAAACQAAADYRTSSAGRTSSAS